MNSLRHGAVPAILILTVLGAAGCATSGHPNTASAVSRTGNDKSIGLHSKGHAYSSLSCKPANVATVAVMRSGAATSAVSGLSPRPLAVVHDIAIGQVAFFHSDAIPAGSAAAVFTSSYRIVADDPSLQSCDMLLADRPAAQPFIKVAIAAAVAHGMAHSVSSLRANLSGIEIGDNPVASGSLIVVLLVAGAPQGTIAGHKVYGPNSSIIVILNRTGRAITGIGRGAW